MGRTIGQKSARRIRKAGKKDPFSSDAERDAFIKRQLSLADEHMEAGRPGAAGKIRASLAKSFNVDPATWTPSSTTSGDGGDDHLSDVADTSTFGELLPDKETQDLLTSKGGENIIMAAGLADAIEGRARGVETLQGQMDAFSDDPLIQSLQGKSEGLLADSDVLSDEDIANMISGSDARLSQSFGNQAAGLASTLGGRGIDPSSGISQELAGALRFGTLQQGAMNENQIRTNAKMLNRQGLENALRLGMGVGGFVQGTKGQLAGGIANLQAGQPLTNIVPSAAALAASNNAPFVGPEGNPMGGALSGAMSGAAAGSAFGPYGTAIGAVAGGLGGYFSEK